MNPSKTPKDILKKLKLNHKCILCNKEIYVGDMTLWERRPYHTSCLIENEKQKAISSNDEKWKQKIKEEIEKRLEDIGDGWENYNPIGVLEELKTSLLKDETEMGG